MAETLLPSNATWLERAVEAAAIRASDVGAANRQVWNPDTAPAAVLPWLAWALSVDSWNPNWPERVKRSVIKASAEVHRIKGTRTAIRRALDALDLDLIRITEWWEQDPPTAPYTFRVEVGTISRGLSNEEFDLIYQAVLSNKNMRSHLESLRVYVQVQDIAPRIGATMLIGETVTVAPYSVTAVNIASTCPQFGACLYGVETVTVYPGVP